MQEKSKQLKNLNPDHPSILTVIKSQRNRISKRLKIQVCYHNSISSAFTAMNQADLFSKTLYDFSHTKMY